MLIAPNHVQVKDDLLLQLATDACAGLAALHRCFRQFNEKYANLIVMLIPRQSHWARRAAKLIFPGENKRVRASCLIEEAPLMDWKVMA